MAAVTDTLLCAGIATSTYYEHVDVDTCMIVLFYQSVMILYSNPLSKIHRTLSCVLAITHIIHGGVFSILLYMETVFFLRRFVSATGWGILFWFGTVTTYLVASECAGFFLALNAFYMMKQLRLETSSLANQKIDPVFKKLVFTFSEIVKFASLARHALIANATKDATAFAFCVCMNLVSMNLEASTSLSLITHAIAAEIPSFVIAEWATVMFLAHYIKPLYEFNLVAVYGVDALFFLRIWYF